MNNKIGRTFTPWTLLKFAAPSIAMMIFMSLYTIVDGIFISRFIGSNALSSLNIVYPIINIVIAIATMLATGGNAIISKYLGQDRKKEANECLTQFIIIGLFVSIVILILTQFFLTPIAYFLGSNDVLLPNCKQYLSTAILFAPACMLQTLFQSYFGYCGVSIPWITAYCRSRYFKCSIGLPFYRYLPFGNWRCRTRHWNWTIHPCHCRTMFLFPFKRGLAFYKILFPCKRTCPSLL